MISRNFCELRCTKSVIFFPWKKKKIVKPIYNDIMKVDFTEFLLNAKNCKISSFSLCIFGIFGQNHFHGIFFFSNWINAIRESTCSLWCYSMTWWSQTNCRNLSRWGRLLPERLPLLFWMTINFRTSLPVVLLLNYTGTKWSNFTVWKFWNFPVIRCH